MTPEEAPLDPRAAVLAREARRAQTLIDAGEHEQARRLLGAALAQARALRAGAGHLHWLFAIASDGLEDIDAAVHHIREAIQRDPASPSFRHSLEIIQGKLQETLLDENRAVDAPDTCSLYALLKSLGPVDPRTHLVVARHLAATGRRGPALELARAVAVVSGDAAAALFAQALGAGDESPWLGASRALPA